MAQILMSSYERGFGSKRAESYAKDFLLSPLNQFNILSALAWFIVHLLLQTLLVELLQ